MKKFIALTIVAFIFTSTAFAQTITNGVLILPTAATPEDSSFFVEAKASETEQGLLLKYGDTSASAELVTDTITKSETESWDVFGNEETKNFYFFGTGRATSIKSVNVSASPSTFQNGQEDTGVQPTITGYDSTNGWTLNIPAANPVGVGQYLGTTFTVTWDGTNSSNIGTTPAGSYYTEVTLSISST